MAPMDAGLFWRSMKHQCEEIRLKLEKSTNPRGKILSLGPSEAKLFSALLGVGTALISNSGFGHTNPAGPLIVGFDSLGW